MVNDNPEHLKYIKDHLIPEIVSKLENETLDEYNAEHTGGLDGFMSSLYNVRLKTKTATGNKERELIVKFMKGDIAFRETTKSYIQFANEIFAYGKLLPTYKEVLEKSNITNVNVDDWAPRAYVAKYGYVEGLSVSTVQREAVLVLDNIKALGYKQGPRLYLNARQLLAMCKPLGEYHALSIAIKHCNPAQFQQLKSEIVTLPFINDDDPNDRRTNLYRVLYRVGFDRFYDFFDRKIDSNTFDKSKEADLKVIESIRHLRELYFAEPTRLLERLRTKIDENDEDRAFAAILHGDFNRNNVLFRYTESNPPDDADDLSKKVERVKMIDFQEMRFGSPVIDLSFYMYINTPESLREDVWNSILIEYHSHLFKTLSNLLKANKKSANELQEIEKILQYYSFEKFKAHFSRFAVYGVMVCIHFLPWLLCLDEECARLAELFEKDMHGDEFRRLSIEAGGDATNTRILAIIKHACKMGYMDHI